MTTNKDNNSVQEPSQNASGDLGERFRSGEIKAKFEYFLFQQKEQVKQEHGFLGRYKFRVLNDWMKLIGISAGAVGIMMLLRPNLFWPWQAFIFFALLFLLPAAFELPRYLSSMLDDQAKENRHWVGQNIILTQAIVDGTGTTVLDDREWRTSGPDCPAGSHVRIVTLDAHTLYVASTANALEQLP